MSERSPSWSHPQWCSRFSTADPALDQSCNRARTGSTAEVTPKRWRPQGQQGAHTAGGEATFPRW